MDHEEEETTATTIQDITKQRPSPPNRWGPVGVGCPLRLGEHEIRAGSAEVERAARGGYRILNGVGR